MALFGFPEHLSEYTIRDYLRIVVIIGGYLIIRPHLVRIGERIQRQKLETEEERSRREAAEAVEAASGGAVEEPEPEPWRVGQGARTRHRPTREEANKKAAVVELMDSDEDVSDLL
uniref:ARAD1C34914p n=1 Tax=Blastobotrys adeninivorans TaxID=409370 RepID=A0A060T2R7_BLAAD